MTPLPWPSIAPPFTKSVRVAGCYRNHWPDHPGIRRRAQSGEFPLPLGPGRADQRRLDHRAVREAGGRQPRKEADLRLRRQCPLSPCPPGPTMAGEAGLPHQADLSARLRPPPPQRHRAIMGRHASRGDPQQVLRQLRPLHQSDRSLLQATPATRVDDLARHHSRQFPYHLAPGFSGSGVIRV